MNNNTWPFPSKDFPLTPWTPEQVEEYNKQQWPFPSKDFPLTPWTPEQVVKGKSLDGARIDLN